MSSTTRSQATTIPCQPRSPTSMSLPLPPDVSPHQYLWPRNPCCDVESTSSAPALTSQNYLRLLPGTTGSRTNENSVTDSNGYVTPRPGSSIHCGCQSLTSQYQNFKTDQACPSTTSSAA